MKYEACLRGCKYNEDGVCELYKTKLEKHKVPDPYDGGYMELWTKCMDCREKELSHDIDNTVREIYSFYKSFTDEMDILFKRLEKLVTRREDIYK